MVHNAMSGLISPIARTRRRARSSAVMSTTTVRDFSGGLNVVDDDHNLTSKFAVASKNIFRAIDGTLKLRYGTRYFATITGVLTGNIIAMEYFIQRIIVVTDTGQIASIDGTGSVTAIWNNTIASALPGAPSGWSACTFVSFEKFKGSLLIFNGIDKPLIVDSDYDVTYLQDLATGSNVNTPRGKYVAVVNEWVVAAGITDEPATIYISSTQTSGTWPGDIAPNDGTTYDVSASVAEGSTEIIGLAEFRGRLLVFFENTVVVVRLGTFTDAGIHDPQVEDTVPQFGGTSHRAAQNLGDDILFADLGGIPSFNRSRAYDTLDPDRASFLIDPEIQQALAAINTTSLRERVFSVYDKLERLYMLFIPNANTVGATTETRCFVRHGNRKLKINAWAEFRDWNWTAACRSILNRIFFSTTNRVYVYGSRAASDEFYADKLLDRDATWTNSVSYTVGQKIYDDVTEESYTCAFAHTSHPTRTFLQDRTAHPTFWTIYTGEEIAFEYEFPWADFDKRMNTKLLRYGQFETKGNAQFTFEVYVDNLVFDPIDNVTRTPELSMSFVANDSPGFGAGDQPYGGGRRTVDERPWKKSTKFKIMKMRLYGSTTASEGFGLISISLGYMMGNYQR
jgi:hypothetical protein